MKLTDFSHREMAEDFYENLIEYAADEDFEIKNYEDDIKEVIRLILFSLK